MKQLIAVLAFALVLIGCNNSNPIDSSSYDQSEATYSELSMYKTTQAATAAEIVYSGSGKHIHDSLRNAYMLDSLKLYLSLTTEQFTKVQEFGTKLFAALADIRSQVHARTIKPDSAMTLVKIARDEFVASVKSILTEEQVTAFDKWLAKHWNRPLHGREGKPGRGPGGKGHRGGHGGGRP